MATDKQLEAARTLLQRSAQGEIFEDKAAFFNPVRELVNWLNGKIRHVPEWEKDFRALAKARDEIADLIRLLRIDAEAARVVVRRDFREIEVRWDVIKDPAGRFRVGTVIEARSPKAFGMSLLSSVCDFGQFDRLRECQREGCGTWFVARHLKRIFCSPDCLQDFWDEERKKPEIKKKRSEARKRQRKGKRSMTAKGEKR